MNIKIVKSNLTSEALSTTPKKALIDHARLIADRLGLEGEVKLYVDRQREDGELGWHIEGKGEPRPGVTVYHETSLDWPVV